MSYLTYNYGIIIHEDLNDTNPKVKLTDISKCIANVQAEQETSDSFMLQPGESKVIAITEISLGWDNTTALSLTRPVSTSDVMRLNFVSGANPLFRTKRNIGIDATTTVSITRASSYIARITSVGGTPINTNNIQVGDTIIFGSNTDNFTSPFSAVNTGKSLRISGKGSNYIEYFDDGVSSLDSNVALVDYLNALSVVSPSPVMVGQSVKIAGAPSIANHGTFEITAVTADYIEFINPYGPTQAFVNDGNINIFNGLMGFVHIRSSDKIQLKFDNQSTYMDLGKIGNEALFAGSVSCFKVTAYNDSAMRVLVSIQTVKVN